MKILAIVADIDKNNFGGAEWHFEEVLKRLLPRLESITLLVGPNNNIRSVFSDSKVSILPVKYPHITNFYGALFILYSLPIVLKLASENKYDLIWAKQEFPQGVVAAIVHLIFKIPLYVTSQSARLNKDELVIRGNVPNAVKDFFSDLLTPVISFVFKNSNMVGAVSKFSAQQAIKLGAKNVVVVPNGVDLSLYRKSKSDSKSGGFQIVTTSSLISRNAVDILIKACHLLPTEINWKLKIAGDGILRSDLGQLAEKLKISKKVEFLGRVANDKIPNLLADSHLFVRVSRAEGFGSSFIEAMAAKIPVIGTPVGGIVDFITNNRTGLLVDVNDPEQLSKSIARIYNQPNLQRRLTTNAYKMILTKYNWENISQEVWQSWNSIL